MLSPILPGCTRSLDSGSAGPVRRGEVWWVDLGVAVGHEPTKSRPALVLSVDPSQVTREQMVFIAPITSAGRADVPSRVPIAQHEGGLYRPGHILLDQAGYVSVLRLRRRMGLAWGRTVEKVAAVLKGRLGIP